jgi:peroxiredoxin
MLFLFGGMGTATSEEMAMNLRTLQIDAWLESHASFLPLWLVVAFPIAAVAIICAIATWRESHEVHESNESPGHRDDGGRLGDCCYQPRRRPHEDADGGGGLRQISVTSPLVGKPAPDFVLADISGTRVTLQNLRGEQNRPVVLFMSAGGGCGTCLAQIGKMNKSAVPTDVSVMAAAVASAHTDSIESWRTFVRDNPQFHKIPILFDMSGDALRAYGATALQSGMNHGGEHSPGHSYSIARGWSDWWPMTLLWATGRPPWKNSSRRSDEARRISRQVSCPVGARGGVRPR